MMTFRLRTIYNYLPGYVGRVRRRIELINLFRGQEALEIARLHTPVQTGNLRDSEELDLEGLFAALWTDVPYAEAIHDGARGMPPRPFFLIAIEAIREAYFADIGRALLEEAVP
jgi:hypothetical protein